MTNRTDYRVIYGDTDQMGVVYYANYLRWFEKGRTEFLRQLGTAYNTIEEKGLYFPVAEVSCSYHKPARFDDEIVIETSLSALGPASLTFSYKLYHRGSDQPIATGSTKHACVTRTGKVTRMPAELAKYLRSALDYAS